MKNIKIGLFPILIPFLAFGLGYVMLQSLFGNGLPQVKLYFLIGALVVFVVVGSSYSIFTTIKSRSLRISQPVVFSRKELFNQTLLGVLVGIGGGVLLYSPYVILISSGALKDWGIFTLPFMLPIASIPIVLWIFIATKTNKRFPQFSLSYLFTSLALVIGTIFIKYFLR